MQTGITTRQLLAAPDGAIYIWVGAAMAYPRALAKKLGRDDIRVVPASWLVSKDRFIDVDSATHIVLDHGLLLTQSLRQGLEEVHAYIKARRNHNG